jgi:hypothetical protein
VVASGKCKARSNEHQATSNEQRVTSSERVRQAQGSSVVGWVWLLGQRGKRQKTSGMKGLELGQEGDCERKCKTQVQVMAREVR